MKKLNLSIKNGDDLKVEKNITDVNVQFLNIKKGKCTIIILRVQKIKRSPEEFLIFVKRLLPRW